MARGFYGLNYGLTVVAVALAIGALAAPAEAELYINEMFIDPPGGETPREYVELRGTPSMSLFNHWFVAIENENTLEGDGEAGVIDLAIDLSSYSVGSNGFVLMRRALNSPYTVNSLATTVELPATLFENSGATYMLIDRGTGPAPVAGMVLDGLVDNDNNPITLRDGLDYPGEGQPGWAILDAIGVFVEINEAGLGRLYAPINFGPEFDGQAILPDFGGPIFNAADHIEPDATYVGTGFEIELIARYGDSTGQTARDWHTTNVTDNALSGFTGPGDFRQSAPGTHGFPRPDGSEFESNQFVPYGSNITSTLGSANFPSDQSVLPWDYNQNGVIDAADYTTWRDLLGTTDPTGLSIFANADRDGSVDQTDYDAWAYHFGESLSSEIVAGAGSLAVPEPACCLLLSTGLLLLSVGRRRC